MTMINPNPPAHHHHSNYHNNNNNDKASAGVYVMSRIEGYGCSTDFQIQLKPDTSLNIHCLPGAAGGGSEEQDQDQDQDHPMADQEDESRTTEETPSTSLLFNPDSTPTPPPSLPLPLPLPHQQDEDDKWLQLSLTHTAASASPSSHNHHIHNMNQMVELDLLPHGTGTSTPPAPTSSMFHFTEFGPPPIPNIRPPTNGNGTSSSSSNYYNYFSSTTNATSLFMHHHHHHGEIEFNWGPNIQYQRNMNILPFSSASSSRLVSPFLLHPGAPLPLPRPTTSIDFRVIDPPPRRQSSSGIWFILQAAHNQAKEPFLPQIPKSFLRIKDGRMTIRIVIKYLVNKLKLENESEVEIKCRGQRMEATLTLQQVRDSVWNTSSDHHLLTLLPRSSATTDHIMVLHYARSP